VKKIIGLSCGRKNGNSETLLKEACMAAEELGIESEIIRAMDMNVKPCRGCEACSIRAAKGEEIRCSITDDDMPWLLEKTIVEDCALIVSAPIYFYTINGYLKIITERMIPPMLRNPETVRKTRVGAIILVGGGGPSATPLGLTMANLFVQHSRVLVDQMQANFLGHPRGAMKNEELLGRARKLGKNVAAAMSMPIDAVKYMGDNTPVSCPVCHCNVLHVPDTLPEVFCPVCWIQGTIHSDGNSMYVQWNEEDIETHRHSETKLTQQIEFLSSIPKEYYAPDRTQYTEKDKQLEGKYASWGKIIRP